MAGNQPFHGSDLDPSKNVSGFAVAPREYNSHQRHAKFARFRYTSRAKYGQLGAFLAAQATRLSSTAAVVYAKVTKYGAARVKAAANLAALP